jgi:cytosine/adenosine deaminase-related metal-dependent hydrolase
VLPPGKALEMATVDGYRALGLDRELGSVEAGKIADLVTVNLFQPHLYPLDMLIHRLVYNATGGDVADVVVAGRLVMQDRRVLTLDEAQVLERAQHAYRRFVARAGAAPHTAEPPRFWGASRSG